MFKKKKLKLIRTLDEEVADLLRENKGKAMPLNYIVETIYDFKIKDDINDAEKWNIFRLKTKIISIISFLRIKYKIHIFSVVIHGIRGYKVIESLDEFNQISHRFGSLSLRASIMKDKIERDRNDLNYKRKVENFYRG